MPRHAKPEPFQERHLPDFPPQSWVELVRENSFPEWGDVQGTLAGRLAEMEVDAVVDHYIGPDDAVLEVGCSQGYTTTETCNITEADVLGVDLPVVVSDGTVTSEYGGGPEPSYAGGVAPYLPVQDASIDGITAFNSVTYLARNIGTVAAERLVAQDAVRAKQYETARDAYIARTVDDILQDFDRATAPDGYVILGEQTDSSYLVLEKGGEATWAVAEYDSFPDHTGPALHLRYGPWVTHPSVTWDRAAHDL